MIGIIRSVRKEIRHLFLRHRGSKFIAYAFPTYTEEEWQGHLQTVKQEHFKARHHCYAFMLGAEQKHFRANDDGEPSNSAGNPILGQIRSTNLTNVLIVVVRYFGGTKLGVSGLIHAYKTAAFDAIENATIIAEDLTEIISIQFEYLVMNDVMKVIKDYDLSLLNQSFDNSCEITLEVKSVIAEEVKEKLIDWIIEEEDID